MTLILVTAMLGGYWAGAQTKLEPEQSHFSAEDEAVHSPVPIPADVWAILKQDRYVQDQLKGDEPSLGQPPTSWFSAAIVHLASLNEDDLLVEAEGEMRGANVNMFWLFLRTPTGPKLVVDGAAHNLTILQTRWHAYRIIRLDSATCCTFSTTWLRFENAKYREYRSSFKETK